MNEELLIPISALQHYVYCPRQCALIHLEQVFDENVYTLRGRAVHEHVDESISRTEEGVRIERALPLFSERLGLIGRADVVEFPTSASPVPVEYKHGRKGRRRCDDIQAAAQAMCLEDMLGVEIPIAVVYHHSSRRRRELAVDIHLRSEVIRVTRLVREMLLKQELPMAAADKRCQKCSLYDACCPESAVHDAELRDYMQELYCGEDKWNC